MLVDLEAVRDSCIHRSQLCIIGGGIAGLTLANSLAGQDISVHLLETGGFEYEDRFQELNQAEITGNTHSGASQGRFRVFGGGSSRWGGQLLPFTPDVLQPPPGSDLPAWPITGSDIENRFPEIESLLGTNHLPFSDRLLESFKESQPFASDGVRLRFSKWAPYRYRNLAKTLGQNCRSSSNVCVYLHSNVTRLEMRDSGSGVKTAWVKTLGGVTHEFHSDIFVLCTGTIEASRLLLASDDLCKAGIGNDHDQVGRYFHDHLSVRAGTLPAATQKAVLRHFTPRFRKGTIHTPKLEATAETRVSRRLLSVMAHFPIEEPEGAGLDLVRTILRKLQSGEFDKEAGRALLRIPGYSFQLGNLLWSAYLRNRRPVSDNAKIALQIDCEQRPQAESRIQLSSTQDRLCSRIAVLNWRVSEDERYTIRSYARILQALFQRNGFGEINWLNGILGEDDTWLKLATDSYHMMGGTRMGLNPARSVVDSDLKVHGISNLYVASCSVFPTGGSSNPTFTLMALALRLSDLLLRKLAYVPCINFTSAEPVLSLPDGEQVPMLPFRLNRNLAKVRRLARLR